MSTTREAPYMRTDTGNAERIVAAYGDRIRYCAAWKTGAR